MRDNELQVGMDLLEVSDTMFYNTHTPLSSLGVRCVQVQEEEKRLLVGLECSIQKY